MCGSFRSLSVFQPVCWASVCTSGVRSSCLIPSRNPSTPSASMSFKTLSIDSGCSIVGLCQSIGFFQDFFLADMTVKSPKPPVLLSLRLPVYLSPQFLQTVWKPLSFFPASPPLKDLRYSRAPSLRQGCVVLAIFATTDSSATLSPVSAFRLSTYNAYPCSCRFLQGRGGFPQLIAHLSIRVAAATPPPSFYLLASLGKRMLPSPKLKRLGQWNSSFTRLHLRSR